MPDLPGIIEQYRLLVNDRTFERRLEAEPEAARAEALVFKFLADHGLHPRLYEDPSSGGMDFECDDGAPFAVEATALTAQTFGERSGFDHAVVSSGWMDTSAVLSLLRGRVSKKGSGLQATSYHGPRVLAIVSEHYMAAAAFLVAAPELLTGAVGLACEVGPSGAVGDSYLATDFESPAYIRMAEGKLEVFRRKHALILLFAAHYDGCFVVGVANPKPDEALRSPSLANIATVSLRWPPKDAHLDVFWSHENRPYRYSFK